jgi:hypothetical protein
MHLSNQTNFNIKNRFKYLILNLIHQLNNNFKNIIVNLLKCLNVTLPGSNISANKNTPSNNISISTKKTYPSNLSNLPNNSSPSFNNTLTTLLSTSPQQLINGNNTQVELSNSTSISPLGGIGNLPGINHHPSSQPTPVIATTSTTAAQAAALSQAVAAMQSLAAGGVQHPLRSLQSPLIQARLAAGAAHDCIAATA